MLAHVEMTKTEHWQYGEKWEIIIGDLENPDNPKIKIPISEYHAENAKKSFTECKKHGKFEENEIWT